MTETRYSCPQEETVKRVIARFGGTTNIGDILKIDRSNVSKWKAVIPGDHALRLLKYAQDHKINLTLEELRPDIFKKNYRPKFQRKV